MKVLVFAVTIVVFAVVIPLTILSPRHADEAQSSAPPAAPVAAPAEPAEDFLSAAELMRHARPEGFPCAPASPWFWTNGKASSSTSATQTSSARSLPSPS